MLDRERVGGRQLKGLPDREVLALAARDGRILVTHDSGTMPRHFGEFVESERSAGVIIVPRRSCDQP
jgi:hypothetical protein